MPQVEDRLTALSVELEDAKSKLQNMEIADTPPSAVVDNQPDGSVDVERVEREKKKLIKDAESHLDDVSERLSHLQCYRNFVHSDLSDRLELREQSANGTLAKVTFSNLWLIFRPGDVIFTSQDGYEQASQVYHVTGGQHLRRRIGSEEYEQVQRDMALRHRHRYDCDSSDEEDDAQEATLTIGSWTPFTIDTFVMGFDGSKIGPLGERQVIRHFEGEKNILDLDVYPIRFHSEREKLLQKMIQRGKKLLQHKGHKSYQGQAREMFSSPGIARPSIQSDVFIDHTTYYRNYSIRKPRLGPRYLTRSSMLLVEEEENVHSGNDSRILHGSEVDSKAAEDFFADNIQFLRLIPVTEVNESPDHLCLLTHTVIGYAFQTRQWCKYGLAAAGCK